MNNRCISVEFVDTIFLKKKTIIINYFISVGFLVLFFIIIVLCINFKNNQKLKSIQISNVDKINCLVKEEFRQNFEEDFYDNSKSKLSDDSFDEGSLNYPLGFRLNRSHSNI